MNRDRDMEREIEMIDRKGIANKFCASQVLLAKIPLES